MPNAAEITSDLHGLIVNPGNSSMVLGGLDYLTQRPARYLARKLTGNPAYELPGILSPSKWGEHAARAGEKLDYTVGKHVGVSRKEDLRLTHEHLKRIDTTLSTYAKSSDPALVDHGNKLRASLDNVIKTHSHGVADLDSVLKAHRADSAKTFEHTLQGVSLPSATGEIGKHVKNLSTDAAAFVGTGHIMGQLQQAQAQGQLNSSPEGAHKMDTKIARIQEALDNLTKVAAMLSEIPKRDEAHKRASELCATGAISSDEIDKYASVFYASPEASDVLSQTVRRIAPDHAKTARLGEVVANTNSYSETKNNDNGDTGGNAFDSFCLSGAGR